jgi:hypothetical protein
MITRRTLRAAAASAVLAACLTGPATAAAGPLRGWWPMNERSGQTVRDWSGNGNHGTLGSTPTVDDNDPTWIKGIFNLGSALRFDGNDFVTIPDAAELSPQRLTVSAWIRKDAPAQRYEYFVAKGSDLCLSASWGLYTTENSLLSFYVYQGEGLFVRAPEAPAEVFDGRWHHVAGTYDGSMVRLFVDGRQIGSGTPTTTPIEYDMPTGAMSFGAYTGTCALYLTGDIDGVSIWDRALPIAEIGDLVRSIIGR